MAKSRGILSLEGQLDGLSFYFLHGSPVVRRPGGFDGKRIKTDPKMVRVRENGSEFGQCSKVNKAFRQALRPFYEGYTFSHFHSRLLGLFTKIKSLDTLNARGKRSVAQGMTTAEGKGLLRGFPYTPHCQLSTQVPFRMAFDWETQTLTVSQFKASQLPFITGSTHVQFRLGVLDFDFETLEQHLELSVPITVDRAFDADAFDLIPSIVGSIDHTGIAVLGMQYFQEVNGELVPLLGEQAVGMLVVSSEPFDKLRVTA